MTLCSCSGKTVFSLQIICNNNQNETSGVDSKVRGIWPQWVEEQSDPWKTEGADHGADPPALSAGPSPTWLRGGAVIHLVKLNQWKLKAGEFLQLARIPSLLLHCSLLLVWSN